MIVSCLVNPSFGGGIARHTREMVAGLGSRSGFECRLLASPRDLARNPRFLDGLRQMPVQPLPLSGVMMDRLWKVAGWPTVDRYVRGSDLLYCPAHARLPAKVTPTVMTVHDVQALEPDLAWSHEWQHRHFRRKWLQWLPRAVGECARVLTVSEFSKRRLVELAGADPAKIGVVGNGVSEPFFAAGRAATRRIEDRVVVVGGVRTKKGAADTLGVATHLRRIGSPLVISVVGHNEPEWEAKAMAMPNVCIEGALDDANLAAQLSRSTALLFLSPYEGFGIPAIEAMAAGSPAVVANAASLPEVVGDAGLVVDATRHAEIAEQLERLRTDAPFRDALVAKGLGHAKRFTWSDCVDRLVEELVKARTRGR